MNHPWIALLVVVAVSTLSAPAGAARVPQALSDLTLEQMTEAGVSVRAAKVTPEGTYVEIALSAGATCSTEEAWFTAPGVAAPVQFRDSKAEVFVEPRQLPLARLILQCKQQPGKPYGCGVGFKHLADPALLGTQPHECFQLMETRKLMAANQPREALEKVKPCMDWHANRITIDPNPRGQYAQDPLGDASVLGTAYFSAFTDQLRFMANDVDWFKKGIPGNARNMTTLEMHYPTWFQSGMLGMHAGGLQNLRHCLYQEKTEKPDVALRCYSERKFTPRRISRMAVLTLATGDKIGAAGLARHALAIDQFDASAMAVLASLREGNGDKTGALCMYRAALHSLNYKQARSGVLPVAYWEAGAIHQGIERLKGAPDKCAEERGIYDFMNSAPEWVMGFEQGH